MEQQKTNALSNLIAPHQDDQEINHALLQDQSILNDDEQSLKSINSNTNDIKNETAEEFNTEKNILRRQKCKKVIGCIIVLILLAGIAVILWARFKPGAPLYCLKYKNSEECHPFNFIITGFQPFGPSPYNPSEILATKLEKSGIKCTSKSLSVDPDTADQFYNNLNEDKDNLPFIVHIGLNANAKEMLLETQAINTLILSPNETAVPIDSTLSLDSILPNPFNVKDLQKSLSSQFSLSNDAGTYICNYIYYRGIQNHEKKNKGCIFVHVPLFENLSQNIQLDNLCNLIQKIKNLYN